MKPDIGQIVLYKRTKGDPDPTVAIITQAYEVKGVSYLWLRLFPAATVESEAVQATSKDMASGPRDAQAGQWWWPERI